MTGATHSCKPALLTSVSAAVTTGLVLLGASSPAVSEPAVVMTGVQVNYNDEINNTYNAGAGFYGPPITINDICANADQLGFQFNRALDALDMAIAGSGWSAPLSALQSLPDMPNRADVARDVANAKEALCDTPEPEVVAETFTIIYSSCRMSMNTRNNAMVITMPPGGSSARMLAADHTTREVVFIDMVSHTDAAEQFIGKGWSDAISMTSLGQTQDIFGYEANHYEFEYESGLGETDMGEMSQMDVEIGAVNTPQRLGNLVKVRNEGNVWLAPNAPGIDIVQSFYQNLTTRFQPGGGANQFMSGMVNNLVGMLANGIPIVIEQTTSSFIMGRKMVNGRSESHIANIRLRDLPTEFCGTEVQPLEDYEVTDINQAMSDATSGAGGASSDDMAAAMQQYNDAMQNLTPEQQAALAQMGMGDMMGGGASAAAVSASAAAPTGSSAGGNMPPAGELQSGTTTESVQKHLAALGYEVGAVDGQLSLHTQIAISTFQAENGMEVTGEVSAPLLGALAVEVDRRR